MTIMMAPFMSCGRVWLSSQYSRLPSSGRTVRCGLLAVYAGYRNGGADWPDAQYTIMRGEATPFVMELPVYHYPTLKA